MSKPNDDDIDIYELLDRADELLNKKSETDLRDNPDTFTPEFDEPMSMDATIVYRNAANSYGQDIRNAANNYGAGSVTQPTTQNPANPTQAEQAVSSIRAYNADFRVERERIPKTPKKISYETAAVSNLTSTPQPAPVKEKPPKEKRKKRGCLTKLIALGTVIALVILLFNLFIHPPKTDNPLENRRSGVSAILLCGADIGGDRTDTMMLLYVDSIKKEAGLLTLPRDTYTVTVYGDSNKLNSAYGRNGGGEEGMEVLFDYVEDTIGYRPDGYVLVELPMLRDLIDLMGGVEFDVPQDMESQGISGSVSLQAGLQHLTGEQSLGLLRFRYGYDNQDLGRQDVQKTFLKACLEQWATVENLGKLSEVMDLFEAQSLTDLSVGNFAWFGLNLLRCGFSNIYTDTLPGYATMIGDQSYYVLYPSEVAAMIQSRYNPYNVEITTDMLNIATE